MEREKRWHSCVGAAGIADAHARATASEKRQQELALEREHHTLFLGLDVVVAEQVKDAVSEQKKHFFFRAVAGNTGLLRGDGGADDDVPEEALGGELPFASFAKFGHGEAHDVGGPLEVHPFLVEFTHGLLVHKRDRQFGGRVQEHSVEYVAGEINELAGIDLGGRFVVDFDAHRFPFFFGENSERSQRA